MKTGEEVGGVDPGEGGREGVVQQGSGSGQSVGGRAPGETYRRPAPWTGQHEPVSQPCLPLPPRALPTLPGNTRDSHPDGTADSARPHQTDNRAGRECEAVSAFDTGLGKGHQEGRGVGSCEGGGELRPPTSPIHRGRRKILRGLPGFPPTCFPESLPASQCVQTKVIGAVWFLLMRLGCFI
ncbi:hypothetical protein E2C01_056281 [Portunus trituberculatus]|uniref:Uncharacterized protein n=1 Tax=Portunus trituberculatus TaxID=210409 RepID=A0A5B7GZ67_PORTR|nr:hypothetical protein [Portunus trituberculatus]